MSALADMRIFVEADIILRQFEFRKIVYNLKDLSFKRKLELLKIGSS